MRDMHTHSENSHDSKTPVTTMCMEMIRLGADAFAVSDHCDTLRYNEMDILSPIKKSVAEAKKANDEFGDRISVLSGVEIGEAFRNPKLEKKIISECDYDVIIGSVHCASFEGEWGKYYAEIDFSGFGRDDLEQYLKRYFFDVLETAEKCDFDILAHLTCPLRYINGKYGLNADCEKYEDIINEILKVIIKRKISLEVNTSCMGSMFDESMPNERILKKYGDLGGEYITLGSDAHIEKNAMHSFDIAVQKLKRIGFSKCYSYKERKAQIYNI